MPLHSFPCRNRFLRRPLSAALHHLSPLPPALCGSRWCRSPSTARAAPPYQSPHTACIAPAHARPSCLPAPSGHAGAEVPHLGLQPGGQACAGDTCAGHHDRQPAPHARRGHGRVGWALGAGAPTWYIAASATSFRPVRPALCLCPVHLKHRSLDIRRDFGDVEASGTDKASAVLLLGTKAAVAVALH